MIPLNVSHFFPHKAMALIMHAASCCTVSQLLLRYTLDYFVTTKEHF